jgi:DNA polymerase-3 subunit epsilon
MVKFTYLPTGETGQVTNEPMKLIPEDVTKLNRITDEMVAGHRIEDKAVEAFASDASVIIAHSANFDRRFAERHWPVFAEKPWACTVNEIEWRKHGFEGSRLEYLLAGIVKFHEAHRAADDCPCYWRL